MNVTVNAAGLSQLFETSAAKILYGRAQRADGFFFFLNSTLVMAHLKRICITMLQHFVPLESRHGRLNSSSGTSACRTSLEKAVEEWRNTKCRRRGRPSGRLQAVVSQFPVVCLQRMGVCGSVGESGSVGGSRESWWRRRMEGGDEQSWAVTPNLAVAPVASADGLQTTLRTNDEV